MSIRSLVSFYPWPGRVFGVSFREPEGGSSRPLVKCTPSFHPPPIAVSSSRRSSFSCASLSGCHLSTTFLSPGIFLDHREWKVPYPRSGVGSLPWAEINMYCLVVFKSSLCPGREAIFLGVTFMIGEFPNSGPFCIGGLLWTFGLSIETFAE